MRTPIDTDDKNPDAKRKSRWPEIDIWFVLVALIALSILLMLTFEVWIHPFSD